MNIAKIAIIVLAGGLTCACCNSDVLPDTKTPVVSDEDPAVVNAVPRAGRGNAKLEAEMQALVNGNPRVDAGSAVKAGDLRLWAYHNRAGQVIPGIEIPQLQLSKPITIKIAPGMGDVIYGKAHQELRKQLLDYMLQYNRYILEMH